MNSQNSLVNFVSDPAFALDSDLHLVGWNKAAQSVMGYSFSEISNRSCYEVLQAILPGGEPLCTPSCKGGECFRQGQLFSVPSCQIRDKLGQFHKVSLSSMVIPPTMKNTMQGNFSLDNTIAIVFFHPNQPSSTRPRLQSLRIFSLGHFALVAEGISLNVEKWKRKQAVKLLKYLITYRGHDVPRERLMECLWPEVDEHHGRDRLKVILYYLRSQLRKAGIQTKIVETVNHAYLLRGDKIWLDADVFELFISEGMLLLEKGHWQQAMNRFGQA